MSMSPHDGVACASLLGSFLQVIAEDWDPLRLFPAIQGGAMVWKGPT